jgi:hypothetical protein
MNIHIYINTDGLDFGNTMLVAQEIELGEDFVEHIYKRVCVHAARDVGVGNNVREKNGDLVCVYVCVYV